MITNFIDTYLGDYYMPIGSGYLAIMAKEYAMEFGYTEANEATEVQLEPGTYAIAVGVETPRGNIVVTGPIATESGIIIGDPHHIVSGNGWVQLIMGTKILSDPPKKKCIVQHLGLYDTVKLMVSLSKV